MSDVLIIICYGLIVIGMTFGVALLFSRKPKFTRCPYTDYCNLNNASCTHEYRKGYCGKEKILEANKKDSALYDDAGYLTLEEEEAQNGLEDEIIHKS